MDAAGWQTQPSWELRKATGYDLQVPLLGTTKTAELLRPGSFSLQALQKTHQARDQTGKGILLSSISEPAQQFHPGDLVCKKDPCPDPGICLDGPT